MCTFYFYTWDFRPLLSYYPNGKFSYCAHYIKWERQTWLLYLKEAAFHGHGKPVHSHFHTNTAIGKHSSLNSTPLSSLHVNRTCLNDTSFKTNSKNTNNPPPQYMVSCHAQSHIFDRFILMHKKKKTEKLECGKGRILHVWFLVPRVHYSLKSLWVKINGSRRNIKVPLIFHYTAVWKV